MLTNDRESVLADALHCISIANAVHLSSLSQTNESISTVEWLPIWGSICFGKVRALIRN